jgi:hypothetical protein
MIAMFKTSFMKPEDRPYLFHEALCKSKINEYKINNNNKTNTKHEFNVKYERYKQDISKDRKLCLGKKL